jgi:hypothetical protein
LKRREQEIREDIHAVIESYDADEGDYYDEYGFDVDDEESED